MLIVGIDEAGRGPLAGDVFAAAVILDPACPILGLNDSKKLSEKRREHLAQEIKEQALAYHIASVSAKDIDRMNILQATMLAMKTAYEAVAQRCGAEITQVLIDGNRIPQGMPEFTQAIIKGDQKYACIMAASILAKVARDEHILSWHAQYPEYAFNQHKGYGTALHLTRLEQLGPCPIHRLSFAPVKRVAKI